MMSSSSQVGDLGSGAGKGGGGGGSIREAGGSFGKMEAANEEEFFYKQVSLVAVMVNRSYINLSYIKYFSVLGIIPWVVFLLTPSICYGFIIYEQNIREDIYKLLANDSTRTSPVCSLKDYNFMSIFKSQY